MIARHTRRMRVLVLLLGLAVIGVGWLAIGAAGDDGRAAAGSQVHADAPEPEIADLPPLPSKMRPQVVQPEAGAEGSAPAPSQRIQGSPPTRRGRPRPRAPAGGARPACSARRVAAG